MNYKYLFEFARICMNYKKNTTNYFKLQFLLHSSYVLCEINIIEPLQLRVY
jgi:hypothetical protein